MKFGGKYAVAVTRLRGKSGVFTGMSRVGRAALTDKLTTDRLLQKIIRRSFYKAAVLDTGKKPVWGALTGIRPGKIATSLLEHGSPDQKALKLLIDEYDVSPERGALCLDTAKAGLRVKAALGERDAALYIGIPFCPTRCHYCSFVSHSVEKSMKLIAPFLEALYNEIDALSEIVRENGLNIIAVYIGGGTPTTLSAPQLNDLLLKLASSFDLSRVKEFTVEAGRPDTITEDKLGVLFRNGATRISINPQSMSDEILGAIGRRHTAEEVFEAVRLSRRAGFRLINMDLIAGLPGDTADYFIKSLQAVLSWTGKHYRSHAVAEKRARLTVENTALPDEGAVGECSTRPDTGCAATGTSYYLYRQKYMSGGFENVGWTRPGWKACIIS